MAQRKKTLLIPVLILTIGIGWLLNTLHAVPGVDWIWTLGLATLGIATLATGLNRVTAVVGPFLLIASLFSVMRQTGRLAIDIEVPCLVIALGLLLLVVQLTRLPVPEWLQEEKGS